MKKREQKLHLNFNNTHFIFNYSLLSIFLIIIMVFLEVNKYIFIFVSVSYLILSALLLKNIHRENTFKSRDQYIKKYIIFYVILWVYVEWVFILNYYIENWWGDLLFFLFLFTLSHLFLRYCEHLDMKPYRRKKKIKQLKNK